MVIHTTCYFYTSDPRNLPTITSVYLCFAIKRLDTFGSVKHLSTVINHLYNFITSVNRYQPFVSFHYALTPHWMLYNKGSNTTWVKNSTLPTNIQYLKIHARNWIWWQASQGYTNRLIGTRVDTIEQNATWSLQHQLSSTTSQLCTPNSQITKFRCFVGMWAVELQ